MRRFFPLGVGVWWLLIPALLAAQQTSKDAPAAGRYRALMREYQTAQSESTKALPAAKTDDERRGAQARKPDVAAFARRFLELARAEPGDRSAFDALSWVLARVPQRPEGEQALELLAASHLDDPRLGPILQHLGTVEVRGGGEVAPRRPGEEPGPRGPGPRLLCPHLHADRA